MSKNCKECAFYKPPQDGYSCGRCEYPVPSWLRSSSSCGGFVAGMEGADCATFKTLTGEESEPDNRIEGEDR